MPSITKALYDEWRYAECNHAECRYAEFHYAECRYAECYYAVCRPTFNNEKHSSLLLLENVQ